MTYWYDLTDVNCVIIEYGRYEAVRHEQGIGFTWTPVLAGPQPA